MITKRIYQISIYLLLIITGLFITGCADISTMNFSFPEQIGETIIYSEHKIIIEIDPRVVFDPEISITSLEPEIMIPDGYVVYPEGPQDFSESVEYVITSVETGESRVWNVHVVQPGLFSGDDFNDWQVRKRYRDWGEDARYPHEVDLNDGIYISDPMSGHTSVPYRKWALAFYDNQEPINKLYFNLSGIMYEEANDGKGKFALQVIDLAYIEKNNLESKDLGGIDNNQPDNGIRWEKSIDDDEGQMIELNFENNPIEGPVAFRFIRYSPHGDANCWVHLDNVVMIK